jgi:hypothetical protein
MRKHKMIVVLIVALIAVTGFIGCSKKNTSSSPSAQQGSAKSQEKPVAPEKNPPGDIPDSQVFIKYVSSQGHYELEVPEGWSQKENGADVTFVDKLDGLSVIISDSSKMPGVGDIKNNQAQELKKNGRAVVIRSVKDIKLTNGPAVKMRYESNSEPDAVTNKQVRLENDVYYFYRNGKLAELRLWAPLGADNVDQWKRISNSFKWG